ncbi:MAG: glycosyltransferase family 2 protein [Leptospiraceae bacterium]|nr:glycosyltransferase family 2 protein [Leptospiraceae bacterium]
MRAPGRPKPKLVSLVIPVYNEARHLQEFLIAIDRAKFPIAKELIFIDDGSKDNSAEIIKNFRFRSKTIFIDQKQNQGKGAALKKGIEAATGDIIGIQDADFEYEIADVNTILKMMLDGGCEVVYGARFSKLNPQVHRTFHYLVNRLLTTLSNLLSGLYVRDMETCYKFFRREILQNIELKSKRFGFEPEITAKIARLKIRVKEVPISYFPRNYMEGKKITWKDGIAALWHLFYFNLILSKKKFFKSTMPTEFLTNKAQWL